MGLCYTYLIGWSNLDKWYYGVRFAKNAHPDDLWDKYKTSSKHVKRFVEQNGDPDVLQIRKTFVDKNKAVEWEHKVLRRLNISKSNKFLNRTDNKSIFLSKEDYKEISKKLKGVPKSQEHRNKLSEAKRKLSKTRPIGFRFYNPAKDPEVKKKMSLAKQGVYDGEKNPNAKKILYREIIFGTLREFYTFLGISRYMAIKLIEKNEARIVK